MTSPDEAFSKWQSKWLVGTLEAFILAALEEKQRYGGELVNLSKQKIDPDVKVPTVYGIINRLKEWGFLYNSEELVKEGITRGTSRKYYELTPNGKEYFQLILTQISELEKVLSFDLSTFVLEEKV